MRTANDVMNRIRWDPVLDQKEFVIGYLDRFKGIMESRFDKFNTSDIPQHRIEYFKFHDVVVWEKSSRIDKVFGSSNSENTLYDVVEAWRAEHAAAAGPAVAAPVPGEEEAPRPRGARGPVRRGRGRRGQPRANFFVCIRVTDPAVRRVAQEVQTTVTEIEPRLQFSCIPTAALHITLCMLEIRNEAALERAVEVLRQMQPAFAAALGDRELHLRGLGHFRDRVLFGAPDDDGSLASFVRTLRMAMEAASIPIADGRDEYTPHMTLVKLNRAMARAVPSIDRGWYLRHLNAEFGTQPVLAMHLCSTLAPKRSDGFYSTAACVLSYDDAERQAVEDALCSKDVGLLFGDVSSAGAGAGAAAGGDDVAEEAGPTDGADSDADSTASSTDLHTRARALAEAALAAGAEPGAELPEALTKDLGAIPLLLLRQTSDAAKQGGVSMQQRMQLKQQILSGGAQSFATAANTLNLARMAVAIARGVTAATKELEGAGEDEGEEAASTCEESGADSEAEASPAAAFGRLVQTLARVWLLARSNPRTAAEVHWGKPAPMAAKGAVVVLRGVAGAGKTRVAHALRRAAGAAEALVELAVARGVADVGADVAAAGPGSASLVAAEAGTALLGLARGDGGHIGQQALVRLLLRGVGPVGGTPTAGSRALEAVDSPTLLQRALAASRVLTGGRAATASVGSGANDGDDEVEEHKGEAVAVAESAGPHDPFGPLSPAQRSLGGPTHAGLRVLRACDVATRDPNRTVRLSPKAQSQAPRHVLLGLCGALGAQVPLIVLDDAHARRSAYAAALRVASAAGWAPVVLELPCVTRALAIVAGQRSTAPVAPELAVRHWLSWEADERATALAPALTARDAAVVVQTERELQSALRGVRAAVREVSAAGTTLGLIGAAAHGGGAGAKAGAGHGKSSSARRAARTARAFAEESVESFQPPAALYTGVFLDEEARAALLAAVPPAYGRVMADHLTLVYKPATANLRTTPVGARVSLRITGWVDGGEEASVQAAMAEIVIPEEAATSDIRLALLPRLVSSGVPHVTISVGPDTSPVKAASVLKSVAATDLAGGAITIAGTVGVLVDVGSGVGEHVASRASGKRLLTDPHEFAAWAARAAPNLPLAEPPARPPVRVG